VNARQLILPYVAAAFAGLPAAAGIRGAQALAGLPLQISQGLLPIFQAKLARVYAATQEVSRPILKQWTVGQCLLLIPCVVIAIFVPDAVGEFFLGPTWAFAGPALPWILLAALGTQLTRTKEMSARLTGDMDVIAVGRLVSIPPSIVMVGWLGATHGPLGAAIGVFLSHALMYFIISAAFARRVRANAAEQARATVEVD
jgi:O-antigen/teichoic acid export membrane protein